MLIEKTVMQEVTETLDVICNRCSKSLRHGSDGFYGLVEAKFSTGYASKPFYDCQTFQFSLCEPCLAGLFRMFQIAPVGRNYLCGTGEEYMTDDGQQEFPREEIELRMEIERLRVERDALKYKVERLTDDLKRVPAIVEAAKKVGQELNFTEDCGHGAVPGREPWKRCWKCVDEISRTLSGYAVNED